ncbi:MAG: hypothetical protein R3C25_07135 [Hyphomonadaceae bacterium]
MPDQPTDDEQPLCDQNEESETEHSNKTSKARRMAPPYTVECSPEVCAIVEKLKPRQIKELWRKAYERVEALEAGLHPSRSIVKIVAIPDLDGAETAWTPFTAGDHEFRIECEAGQKPRRYTIVVAGRPNEPGAGGNQQPSARAAGRRDASGGRDSADTMRGAKSAQPASAQRPPKLTDETAIAILYNNVRNVVDFLSGPAIAEIRTRLPLVLAHNKEALQRAGDGLARLTRNLAASIVEMFPRCGVVRRRVHASFTFAVREREHENRFAVVRLTPKLVGEGSLRFRLFGLEHDEHVVDWDSYPFGPPVVELSLDWLGLKEWLPA